MELPKTYDPASVEQKWYARWLEAGHFRAAAHSPKPPFSIVMPPPNITGVLTLGHVLNNTIQDILARRARMQGFEVLWLPGTDHAGVGTQTAVEKHLWRTEKKTRHDLGREEFLRRVLEWQEKHGGIIIEQLKRLGCSCDWSRQRYTFDDKYVRAVQKVFVDLYKKGLIKHGPRMINWDPAALTALSDEEVIATPQKGSLYYVRYAIVEEPGRFLEVATTRPETIMADTAVAVHPRDKRYRGLIGKHAWRPLARESIPILGDEVIDPEFGTGVLKVTPGHDKTDFEIGQRHKLPTIDVLHPDGRINCPEEPELDGLSRFVARKKASELLAERGLLAKEEPYENTVGFSERAGVPIEPRISEQWFLRYRKTKEAFDVVHEHLIRFFPSHWEKVYAQWLENIQDWCISRQVWWGHQVPVWVHPARSLVRPEALPRIFLPDLRSAGEPGGKEVSLSGLASARTFLRYEELYRDDRSLTIYAATTDPAEITELRKNGFVQDPDTLDTWFSAWLWAYETMDEGTRNRFYPTSILVTAPDIIFFWVARMIIAGLEFLPSEAEQTKPIDFSKLADDERVELFKRNIPFSKVYFTGLIRDKQGRKMSKSLGNSPDPLDLIDKYGADGLRFGLMRIAPSGQDIRFDEKQIEEGRNFATKLWNAARFRIIQGPSKARISEEHLYPLSIYSIEVLNRLGATIEEVNYGYRNYEFNVVAQALYRFFWNDYCDWFMEAAKEDIMGSNQARRQSALAVMDCVLSHFLRMLHPFMPHVTAELWATFGFEADSHGRSTTQKESIMFAASVESGTDVNWHEAIAEGAGQANVAQMIYEAVRAVRNLRAEYRIPSNRKVRFVLRPIASWVSEDIQTMSRLINASELSLDPKFEPAPGTPMVLSPHGEIYMPLEGMVDTTAERERLDKEIAKMEDELRVVNAKLSNSAFLDRAPSEVVQEHQRRKANFTDRLAQLQRAREALN